MMATDAATRAWRIADGRSLDLGRPVICGILNVTPDSFSDGGRHLGRDAALSRAEAMLAEGADVIDVGGESTRPYNDGAVDARTERLRVEPIIAAIMARFPTAVISVDTVKSEVARAALDAGAAIVNDVSGLRLDPAMPGVVARAGAGVVVMHSRGEVRDMATYAHADYPHDAVVEAVVGELAERATHARSAGIVQEAIVLDPGVGFSKRPEHSVAVLRRLDEVVALGYPVLVGASRKRFIGTLTGVPDPLARVHGTAGAHVAALARGARLFRVHDVMAARHALDVAWAILGDERAG